ncbi:MAG: META domain-containing protein [Tannerella sp.]|jgi:heat shock protein HslJ|nr:META domain-containing protein [Tannerella sp.]
MKQTLFIAICIAALSAANACRPGRTAGSSSFAATERTDANLSRLAGKRWMPVALYGQPVVRETEAFLTFDTDSSRISGNSGCNIFRGAYRSAADGALQFSHLISTRKMCLGENIEERFSAALSATVRYVLRNDSLVFFDNDGAEICLFDEEPNR